MTVFLLAVRRGRRALGDRDGRSRDGALEGDRAAVLGSRPELAPLPRTRAGSAIAIRRRASWFPAAARVKLFEKLHRIDGSLDEDWPEASQLRADPRSRSGTRIGEVAFVHGPSRTLVLTDASSTTGTATCPFWRAGSCAPTAPTTASALPHLELVRRPRPRGIPRCDRRPPRARLRPRDHVPRPHPRNRRQGRDSRRVRRLGDSPFFLQKTRDLA
jgi:hypothetical protein